MNSSTWCVTALFLLALFGTRLSQSLAVMVLAVADPAAALIGRRFGRTRLRDGRSLEGTLAFFAAGALSALAVMWALGPASLSSRLVLAAVAGLGRCGDRAVLHADGRQLHHPGRRGGRGDDRRRGLMPADVSWRQLTSVDVS